MMVAAGASGGESRGLVKPAGAQAEEVGAADIQKFSGGEGIPVAAMESGERLEEKLWGEASGPWVFFKRTSNRVRARRESPFVPPASLLLFPPRQLGISHLTRAPHSHQLRNSSQLPSRSFPNRQRAGAFVVAPPAGEKRAPPYESK